MEWNEGSKSCMRVQTHFLLFIFFSFFEVGGIERNREPKFLIQILNWSVTWPNHYAIISKTRNSIFSVRYWSINHPDMLKTARSWEKSKKNILMASRYVSVNSYRLYLSNQPKPALLQLTIPGQSHCSNTTKMHYPSWTWTRWPWIVCRRPICYRRLTISWFGPKKLGIADAEAPQPL